MQRAADKWIRAAQPDIAKAGIKPSRTKASGRLYSAFVCPACDSVMGQHFISRILPEKSTLLSGPTVEPAPAPGRPDFQINQASPTPMPVRVGQLPSGMCDRCGNDPHPEYECLWRRLRARANVPDGSSHYSDTTYAKIAGGRKAPG